LSSRRRPGLPLTEEERLLVAESPAPAPPLFIEIVRVRLWREGLDARFERHLDEFQRELPDGLAVGHVIVCADRACREAGIAPIRDY
jgi:hypothetical protein